MCIKDKSKSLMKNFLFKKKQIIFGSILMMLSIVSCTVTKDVSNEYPYNQCLGKHFILKENVYIFKPHDSKQHIIAAQHSGIMGLPPLIDKKYFQNDYFGKNNKYLEIDRIIEKGSIFKIIKVNYVKDFESSSINFLVIFDNGCTPKYELLTYPLENILQNPPNTSHWSDPPIFKAGLVEPLPSDGIWWK